jgi:hypothetical protein
VEGVPEPLSETEAMILRAVDWHWTLVATEDALVEQTGMEWDELETHLNTLAYLGLVEVGYAQTQGHAPGDAWIEVGWAHVTPEGHEQARSLAT